MLTTNNSSKRFPGQECGQESHVVMTLGFIIGEVTEIAFISEMDFRAIKVSQVCWSIMESGVTFASSNQFVYMSVVLFFDRIVLYHVKLFSG